MPWEEREKLLLEQISNFQLKDTTNQQKIASLEDQLKVQIISLHWYSTANKIISESDGRKRQQSEPNQQARDRFSRRQSANRESCRSGEHQGKVRGNVDACQGTALRKNENMQEPRTADRGAAPADRFAEGRRRHHQGSTEHPQPRDAAAAGEDRDDGKQNLLRERKAPVDVLETRKHGQDEF